ncbi:TonB-dependent receptor [Parabacteroides timonensis]|uniref:TonB-dependent receptor n=1 Tax=Parabacteroides timonensis TaxID=1871013 RepID=UPI000B41D0BD|nr:TonB-dependent receptor [Parabacteroides timonensis]
MKLTNLIPINNRKSISRLLLVTALSSCSLFGYAQQQQVKLTGNNITLKAAFKQIEQQTKLFVDYNTQEVNDSRLVSRLPKNSSVKEVLNQLLEGTGCSASFSNGHIIITKQVKQEGKLKRVSGVVKDERGEPIIGANIVVKGTTNGTITDMDGNFSFETPENAILLISYIGYAPTEMKLKGQSSFNVILKEDTELLDEVVVVGYGTVKKGNLTTSVTSVKSETLQNRPIQTVTDALQGEVAGLNITSSGRPGEASKMQLRGATSLNESGSPLVLIDGVPGEFNYLNVDDIDNVTVLKDAASAAIYGSRAAHGVILVTTKRGKTGKPTFRYNGYVGINTPTDMPETLSSAEYATVLNEAYRNIDKSAVYSTEDIAKFASGEDLNRYPSTNWLDLMFQNSISTRHSITASGGNETVKYHLSGGLDHQTGVIPEISQNVFNVRSNVDVAITKRFGISFDFRYIQRKKDEVLGFNDIIKDVYKMNPTQVAYYTDGTYGYNSSLIINPIAYLKERGHGYQDKHDASGVFKLDYEILDGLKFSGIANVNYVFDNTSSRARKIYFTEYFTQKQYENGVNSLKEERDFRQYYNLQALLNYKKKFKEHNFDILAGFQSESESKNNVDAFRDGFPTDLIYVLDAGSKDAWSNEGTAEHWSIASVIGRINYDYAGKYMLSASFRSDGSSNFAKGHRWSTFPTVSAAWRVTGESFMKNTTHILDDLKIRASWGMAGASSGLTDKDTGMSLYPSYTTITMGNVVLNGLYSQSAYLKSLGNTNLNWEKTYMFDIGLDAQFLGNRLSVVADYYSKDTRAILIEMPVPMEYGLGKPKMNIGKVSNRGWELEVGWTDQIKDFRYSIRANVSDNKNEVKDIGGSNAWISDNTYTNVGYPIKSIYGYEAMGLFQSEEEIANAPFQNVKNKPGDVRYVDQNKDNKIDGEDRVIIGDPNPHYLFGLRLSGEYKGFDLSMFFQGIGKKDYIMTGPGVRPFNDSPLMKQHMDYWSETNRDAAYPRVQPNAEGNFNYEHSDFWKINGGYLRLKNLQLGYKLPQTALSAVGLRYMRVFFSATNLFTIDNFVPGYDPETENAFTYPLAKTYSFGLNVEF